MTLDISYPQALLVLVVLCVSGGLVWGLATSTTALGPYNYDWDGTSDLRNELEATGATVEIGLSTDEYGTGTPAETVAVVLDPGDRYSDADAAQLSAFLQQGGTLVVASSDNETNDLLATLDTSIRIDGTPVRDDQSNYRNPALVRATNVSTHDFVAGVDALTLNRGTTLVVDDGRTLVNTSQLAYLDENRNEALDANETVAARPVAGVESVGQGQVVVVSDESVFMNAMLGQAGNERFVRNLGNGTDRVLLDYSHGEPLQPLVYVFLTLRSTPLLQFFVGLAGIGLLVGWPYRDRLVPARSGDQSSDTVWTDEQTLSEYLTARHPEWDDERVERVTKAIIQQRGKGGQ